MEPQNLRTKVQRWREERRLDRQFGMVSRSVPGIGGPINAIRPGGRASMLRLPIGLLMIVGGLFSFLPFLGFWMLPLGLLLLAVDIPFLRSPVSAFTIRGRRFTQNRWRKNRFWGAPVKKG